MPLASLKRKPKGTNQFWGGRLKKGLTRLDRGFCRRKPEAGTVDLWFAHLRKYAGYFEDKERTDVRRQKVSLGC